jgi:hypothetical protein
LLLCISLQYEGAVVFANNEGFYDVIVALLDDVEMRLGIQLNALRFAGEYSTDVAALHEAVEADILIS